MWLSFLKKQGVTLALAVSAGFFGAWVFQKISTPAYLTAAQQPQWAVQANYRLPDGAQLIDFTFASQKATPSVVYIKTTAQGYQSMTFFDFFFNGGNGYGTPSVSSGSGVIYSTDGYIITNNHVIDGADKIEVIYNRKSYSATVVGTDPSSDLALLKIEETNLPAVQVAKSKDVKVGEWVLAVGNPFNLESTVTAGIVSAKGRNIHIIDNAQFPIESFIQTDAAINPGNSGGALVNLKGELIGINTAILSQTGSYAGYGFAVPADIVMKIVEDLKKHGVVQKAFIGAEVKDVDAKMAQMLSLKQVTGVVVSSIETDGAAQKAGIEMSDVILKINEVTINSKTAFDEQMSYYRPGDVIKIDLLRDGKPLSKELKLTNINGTDELVAQPVIYNARKTLGADLEPASKTECKRLGIESGVRINRIYGGLLGQMGFDNGYIITKVNNRAIVTPEELEEILTNIHGRVTIAGYDRQGRGNYVQFIF